MNGCKTIRLKLTIDWFVIKLHLFHLQETLLRMMKDFVGP